RPPGGREQDRGGERLGGRLGRVARPRAPALEGEPLRLGIPWPREREDRPALEARDLRHEPRRVAEPVEPEPLDVSGEPLRAVADRPGAQERGRRDRLERRRYREAEPRVGHDEVGVTAGEVVAGEPRVRAEVLAAARAEPARAVRPPQPRDAHEGARPPIADALPPGPPAPPSPGTPTRAPGRRSTTPSPTAEILPTA